MKRITVKTIATSALVSLGLLGAGTMAANAESHMSDDDIAEIQSFQSATQTLAQAVTAAEADTGGTAMSAEFEVEGTDGPAYKVEILMADGTTQTAMVDAMDGTVTAMAKDAEDSDTGDMNGEDGDDDREDGGADGEADDDGTTGN